MGKTFVYNSGSSEDSIGEDELENTFGLFFDGTLNNRRNTELRKKYRNKDKEDLTEAERRAVLKEENDAYAKLEARGFSKTPDEYERYLKSAHRTEADLRGTDNSYSNDYTNVARMYLCCEQDKYGIYIEGIGTEDEKRDVDDGFAFGADVTGIRGKVRKGCEELAKRVSKILKDRDDKTATQITVDVFGFSRGAAAARNFVYEVNNVKKPYEPTPKEVVAGYTHSMNPMYSGGPIPIYKTIYSDSDGIVIDSSLLINGKMPKMGHLGYALRKKDISHEQLETLILVVRFLGVYDTVSSYAETGNLDADDKYIKLAKAPFINVFKDNVEELQLNNVGRLMKAVHFTAKDEHRENFDLTRMPFGIEKNFPGVHCDIGGAYENEEEIVDEIEVVNKQPTVGYNSFDTLRPQKKLREFKDKLISDYWYKEEQLVIGEETYLEFLEYTKLTGTRSIRKEYSYIPLHFMRRFCLPYMEKYMTKSVVKEYSIKGDETLVFAKKHLQDYVFKQGKEWEFISDAEIAQRSKEREKREELQQLLGNQTPFGQLAEDNPNLAGPRVQPENKAPQTKPAFSTELDEVFVYSGQQGILRKLRSEYLHWSATRDWLGMDPNNNRIRNEK